jgi:putative hydrolases of HD superfamily
MIDDQSARLLGFFELAAGLKQVRRQGWMDRGVRNAESVADHSWSVALLAWCLAAERDDLDRNRVLLLGLVHDLPEALAGDVTPFDVHRDADGNIAREHFVAVPGYSSEIQDEKRKAEEAALTDMLAGLPEPLRADLFSAWQEYDENQTPEARFVKQVDKLETVIQADLYQRAQPELVIDSFRAGARRDVIDPQLQVLLDVLLAGDEDRSHPDF